jgi:hypothetical protein
VEGHEKVRAEIQRLEKGVGDAICAEIDNGGALTIVKAPPGSGKTYTLLQTAIHAFKRKLRVAVGAQTNAQADDICRRIAQDCAGVRAFRFLASGTRAQDLGRAISCVDSKEDLPQGPCLVVATTAKWGMVNLGIPFDVMFIDEAWQMKWADFMLCGQVAGRFVLIGDPGQIPPVVPIDSSRWETSQRPPHFPAPEVILKAPELCAGARVLELPASRRLPHDSVDLIQLFYDFHFHAWAGPGERAILASRPGKTPLDRTIDLLAAGSAVILTIPTREEGPPLEKDEELARIAAQLVQQVLDRGCRYKEAKQDYSLAPESIGISSTHRVMNTALHLALPSELRNRVDVDTPERWQGIERQVMIAVHPLSGVVRPSVFDLETGRLCVMASRHRGGLVILTRDHVWDTLNLAVPSAEQPLGRADIAGRGHKIHTELWERLDQEGRIVRL